MNSSAGRDAGTLAVGWGPKGANVIGAKGDFTINTIYPGKVGKAKGKGVSLVMI